MHDVDVDCFCVEESEQLWTVKRERKRKELEMLCNLALTMVVTHNIFTLVCLYVKYFMLKKVVIDYCNTLHQVQVFT